MPFSLSAAANAVSAAAAVAAAILWWRASQVADPEKAKIGPDGQREYLMSTEYRGREIDIFMTVIAGSRLNARAALFAGIAAALQAAAMILNAAGF